MMFILPVLSFLVLVHAGLEDVLAPHDLFSKFHLTGPIGEGASGKVYQATYEGGDGEKSEQFHDAAIKMVERREDTEKELETEIRALKELGNCRGVQKFFVAFEHCDQGSLQLSSDDRDSEKKSGGVVGGPATPEGGGSDCYVWIVTRWVEGESLSGRIAGGQTFSPHQAKSFGGKLFKTLRQVHQKGIVHSDLDSSNIIIGSENVPTVVDFGEAEFVGEGGEANKDVVGLVLTLVEMITGTRKEFEDETVEEKCDYLHGATQDDHVGEELLGLCKDVCEKCVSGCTAMDFTGHKYFA